MKDLASEGRTPSSIPEGKDPATGTPLRPGRRRDFMLGSVAAASAIAAFHRQVEAAVPLGSVERPVPADPARRRAFRSRTRATAAAPSSRPRSGRATRPPRPSRRGPSRPCRTASGSSRRPACTSNAAMRGTATIDPAKHSLFLHGMVQRARKFSMADIKRFPSVSRVLFIECSGNGLTEWSKPTLKTVQGTHGLTSTSEWTGVPLSTLLREAGVQGRGQMDPGGGRGRCGDDPQHPDRQGDEGLPGRLRPERRGDPAGAGLSAAPDRARLRRQHAHQVAPAAAARGHAVHDPRGDVEVHRPAARRQGAAVLLRDGSQIGDHLALRRDGPGRQGLSRDHRPRMVRPRGDPEGGSVGRWRQQLEGSRLCRRRCCR